MPSGTNQLAEAYDTNWGNIPDCLAWTLWRTSVSPGRSEAGGQTRWFVQKVLRGTQTVVRAHLACEEAGGRVRDLVPEPRCRRCGRLYSQRLFEIVVENTQSLPPSSFEV